MLVYVSIYHVSAKLFGMPGGQLRCHNALMTVSMEWKLFTHKIDNWDIRKSQKIQSILIEDY